MITDTIVADPKNAVKKPIKAFLSNANDGSSLYNVYLEFIIYWTGADVENYSTALLTATGLDAKDLLYVMFRRKREMIHAFDVYRVNGKQVWSESAFGTGIRSSEDNHIDFTSIRCLMDAFHFAYRKEYESLALFEKVGRSNLDTTIRALLENAAEHQRRHILHLDDRLSCVNNYAVPAIGWLNTESKGGQWDSTIPSE